MLDQGLVIQTLQAPFARAHVVVDQYQQAAAGDQLKILSPDPPFPPALVDPPALDDLLHYMAVTFPCKREWCGQLVAHNDNRHAVGPEAAHRRSSRTRRSGSRASGSASRACSKLPAKRPFRRSSTSRRRWVCPPAGAKRSSCSTTTALRSETVAFTATTPDSSAAERLSASSAPAS